MGLLTALSNAVSGLNVNQQQLSVLSQNISNANTANYSNEVMGQQSTFNNGLGTGVSAEAVTRTINQFLTSEVQSQTSVNSGASTIQSYYSQIENLLGQPGASNSIDSGINSFFTAVQDLANSPSVSSETAVVNSGVAAANQISSLAQSLQGIRLQADSDINTAVNNVNSDLQTLYTTNTAIERSAATNQSTAGLFDQRDATLANLAQYMDISPSYGSDGEVSVNTSNGLTLLTPSSVSKLTYTPAASTQTFINNNPLAAVQVVTLGPNGAPLGNPISLVTGGTSSTVTTSLTSGTIQSLLSMRDSIIPGMLSQLDELAANMRDTVNSISNQGSSFPPPNSLTGQRLVTASTASQWSGDVQISVLNSNGTAVTSPYSDETNGVPPITLNLSTLQGSAGTGVLTAGDIANAINQAYGTPQNKTEIGNINNVQLGVLSNNVPAAGNAVNFDFNLNNISSSNANFFVNGVTVLNSSGATVASSAAGTVTSTQPSVTIANYQVNSANTVTVNTSGNNTLTNGETIYLNAGSTNTVGGSGTTLGSGYYTVENVTGTSFNVTLAGATTGGGTTTATNATALPPYATVGAGQTVRTGNNGSFTATGLSSGSSSPYYTVQANISTFDANGNPINSVVSYTVPNNTTNTQNTLIGASSQTGAANIVSPTTTQPLVTATLVDANGNPLTEINGSYGSQSGYLKITADNSSYTVAVNELNSSQLGLPNAVPPQAGTKEGFSQYFGLNNFFNVNSLTPTGDTVANSALNLSVNSTLVNNPGLVTTGTLAQADSSTSTPNYTYQVASGDNSISQKLAAVATQTLNFATTGGMPQTSTSLSQYAGQIIAKVSSNSTDATNTANDSQTLLSGFTTRAQAVSGVNLDQELANTVIYQNAYSASTRVITVVSAMFEQLLGIIQ